MFVTTSILSLFPAVAVVQETERFELGAREGVRYELLEGSTLTDLTDLSPGNPVHPIRGSFELELLPTGPPFDVYRISKLRFRSVGPPRFKVRGAGFHSVIGAFPSGSQEMDLVVAVNDDTDLVMTSGLVAQEARFGTIEIVVQETPTTNEHLYVLELIAERPSRFAYSIESGLTSARVGPVSGGDLLWSSGRVLRTNNELTQLLGIMPIAPDIGLDALGLTPATSSLLFSAEVDVFSETLGPLQHGDLLNEHGFVAQTNQQLTDAFVPQPAVPDVGLDGFHVNLSNGELWFSLEEPLFSEALGITLLPGDLLSDAGYVVRTNAELLQRFDVVDPDPSGYGLDAVSVRQNGTILFSVEQGFVDARFGPIGHGDILSDNGHVIRRNLDLVWPFEPFEDLDDFGLDALQVGGR